MIAREIRETIAQTAFVMSFYLFVPLLYLMDVSMYDTGMTLLEYMANGLDLMVMVTSIYLAYNMFRREENDGAAEYLLSLPVSRCRILAVKTLPRIVMALVLLFAAMLVNRMSISQGSVLGSLLINWRAGIPYLALMLVFVQLGGFTLNLVGRRSWSTRLVLLLMVVLVWQSVTFSVAVQKLMAKTLGWRASLRFSWTIGRSGMALIDFSVFFLLLWYILRPLMEIWDLKPGRFRELWFHRRMLLPLVVFILLMVNCLLSPLWHLNLFYYNSCMF